jgi:bifunctional DNA-binding transcriptional regulator/antitoxin component of YhaV-PrlF toxin-antitoxin module
MMLTKRTVKNQITLPKTVIARFGDVEYFDVSTDGETIVLRPLQKSRADEVRARLAQLGVDEQDIAAAVSWARETA